MKHLSDRTSKTIFYHGNIFSFSFLMNKILRSDFLLKCLFLCEILAVYVHTCFGSKEWDLCQSSSRSQWLYSTFGKLSARKTIRDHLYQIRKTTPQQWGKRSTKNLTFINSTKPGRKNFHGLNLAKPKMKCFVEFAVNIPPFVTKVAAFFWVLTVHRELVFVVKARLATISWYHYFCFERVKTWQDQSIPSRIQQESKHFNIHLYIN